MFWSYEYSPQKHIGDISTWTKRTLGLLQTSATFKKKSLQTAGAASPEVCISVWDLHIAVPQDLITYCKLGLPGF